MAHASYFVSTSRMSFRFGCALPGTERTSQMSKNWLWDVQCNRELTLPEHLESACLYKCMCFDKARTSQTGCPSQGCIQDAHHACGQATSALMLNKPITFMKVEHRGMTPLEALHYVRSKRPRVLLAAAQWKAVQEFSKQLDFQCEEKSLFLTASYMPVLSVPWCIVKSSLTEVHTSSPTHSLEGITSDIDEESYVAEDTPVFVSSIDLVGYNDIQDAGCANKHWQEFGVVCRLRLLAAKNVVGAAKASAAWARLSSLWLGCDSQTEIHNVKRISSAEGASCKTMASNFAGQLPVGRIDVPVCQSGMVNC
ncbi:hypothetical protein O6H91_06G105900 [Diphasiastrum complanatum]|uniref:Uncharacterized protein n=1 Tax=Diphasiastrum complanatum TaxID=34168 RepID=A0ACC2DHH0_DIPCM|nr:hypothetical protein O6H91_06G105900 [Diphasiastrum complanatum]